MIQAPPPVLLADDELFLQHVAPADHPERADRLLAVRRGLAAAGAAADSTRSASLVGRRGDSSADRRGPGPTAPASHAYINLTPRDATDEELARVHEPKYVDTLGHLAGRTGYLDSDTYLSPQS